MVAMGGGLRSAAEATTLGEDYVSPPKYKSSLLHRYLNDSLRHVMVANAVIEARKRNHSGSFSSNEYDEELLSPSSSEAEANFVYRAGKRPHFFFKQFLIQTLNILHFGSFFSLPICSLCLNSHRWSIIFNHLVWFLSLFVCHSIACSFCFLHCWCNVILELIFILTYSSDQVPRGQKI